MLIFEGLFHPGIKSSLGLNKFYIEKKIYIT